MAPSLTEALRGLVEGLEVGESLPSERALAEKFGVARMTVRGAIEELARDGLVRTRRGHGTVRLPELQALQVRLDSFQEAVRDHGMVPSTVVLELEVSTDRPVEASEFLALEPDEETTRLVRLRLGDDVPLALERAWIPTRHVADMDAAHVTGSLYSYLNDRDLMPDAGEQLVTATLPSADEAEMLQVSRSRPVLFLTRSATTGGMPIEYAEAIFPSDRYQVRFPVQRPVR